MEIKTDDLFDSEFDKCVDYALWNLAEKQPKNGLMA